MVAVRRLQTRTEAFWRDQYEVSEDDMDLVTGVILEAGKPQRLSALVSAIVKGRIAHEKDAVARQSADAHLYRPMGHYEVGQPLVFSALGFAVGQVVSVRTGDNPKYGAFGVVRVAFEDGSGEREFATDFDHPHPLNRPVDELVGAGDAEMSESALVRMFEHYVARRLEPALQAHHDFVQFDGQWFLAELLPEIHVGYLNLAEAMIYEARGPLNAEEMLGELDLAASGSTEAQLFALSCALAQDERFDNVSMTETPSWYLRALEPEAAFNRPQVLQVAFRAVGGEYLGLTMLDLVEEVGDELDDLESMILREATSFHFEVCFPHLYAGTMPAQLQFLRMLPSTPNRHLLITLVDAKTGERLQAWVVPEERYVCGLGDWYTSVGMCVGGQVQIAATDEPLAFTLSVAPPRRLGRNVWLRIASVADDKLVLRNQPMRSTSVAVGCDLDMLIDVQHGEAIARLMSSTDEAQPTLSALVRTAFQELAKLSGRGVVHAKSIYSMVNLLRRTGAVPVFAELTRRVCYDPVGDGVWAYDPDLEGSVYRTPDEMRERPRSQREDLIRDQVVQYRGR